jgi:DNA invertase Pin-like site-specific DNA recombinase
MVKSAVIKERRDMASTSHNAAQYIRMSTDKQDLSPAVQKAAIASYAVERGLDVTATYEDAGRSGMRIENRPALRQLLRDVTNKPAYSTILVYDVSRWGRFQDVDESAYHEYHCRRNGVAVHYVAEPFAQNTTPMTALLKSLKRVMAAEYSRELGAKCRAGQERALQLGFQMGRLPALGYRRLSVSRDGEVRVPIEDGQRKIAATDRVAWVLGPAAEVALVRRIFNLYASGSYTGDDLVQVGSAEGWRDATGNSFSAAKFYRLLHNEAVIGNFVWGGTYKRGPSNPPKRPTSRCVGCVPRIVDDETWTRVQERLQYPKGLSPDAAIDALRRALRNNPFLPREHLTDLGLMDSTAYSKRFGSWAKALRSAGADLEERQLHGHRTITKHRAYSVAFGKGLAEAMTAAGVLAWFDGAFSRLLFPGADVYVRVLRAQRQHGVAVWSHIRTGNPGTADHVVYVFAHERPVGAALVPIQQLSTLPASLRDSTKRFLTPYWCNTARELVDRLSALSQPSKPVYALRPTGAHVLDLSTSIQRRRTRDARRAVRSTERGNSTAELA